ncbi:peptidyl-prolyl cis-trans isomerase-like 3 [Platysternon megacephalum]|uniref:Peptidyl-prolyl cis-trans isomerase-like 3 n=1 Tax=Platysternon megacephalum TaxID=55544 RepID=A0A4D9EWZ9_9SAUR|nr:peptidyl-prolyl cis-trans isomerase-like 3 [Platysternon megacephalum]
MHLGGLQFRNLAPIPDPGSSLGQKKPNPCQQKSAISPRELVFTPPPVLNSQLCQTYHSNTSCWSRPIIHFSLEGAQGEIFIFYSQLLCSPSSWKSSLLDISLLQKGARQPLQRKKYLAYLLYSVLKENMSGSLTHPLPGRQKKKSRTRGILRLYR